MYNNKCNLLRRLEMKDLWQYKVEYADDPESNTNEFVTFDELPDWVKGRAESFRTCPDLFCLIEVAELTKTTIKGLDEWGQAV
jgi:hypothetical protein